MIGNAYQYMATISNDDLSQCFSNLGSAGKELVVAAGALKGGTIPAGNCNSAAACWAEAAPSLRRFRDDDGATISYLEIDEPLSGKAADQDYTYAVQQTAEFIRLARLEFANLKVILQESYPSQNADTLAQFFVGVNNETTARTGWGIQYAQIDHDWNDTRTTSLSSQLLQLVNIQSAVHAAGMKFGVIFWSTEGRTWYDGLMHQGEFYRTHGRFGLAPDMYAVINWRGTPVQTLPEWNGTGTYMRSVRDFANTYLPVSTGVHGLRPGEHLVPGESRTSVDGRFTLSYQQDGNLVLYRNGTTVVWQTRSSGRTAGRADMQLDGNFVVYDAAGQIVWKSNTSGSSGAFLVVQSDGNVVIYIGRHPVWATNTDIA
jgi:hypothetical protein